MKTEIEYVHDAMVVRILDALRGGGKHPPDIVIGALSECLARAAFLLYGKERAPEMISEAVNEALLQL